jgi:hypothetical protein
MSIPDSRVGSIYTCVQMQHYRPFPLIDMCIFIKTVQQRTLLGGRRMSEKTLQDSRPGTPKTQAKILSRRESVFSSTSGYFFIYFFRV